MPRSHGSESSQSLASTYAEVGSTKDAELPEGFNHLRRTAVLGVGTEVFESAVAQLFSWQMHRGAGLGVECSGPVVEGTMARLVFSMGFGRFSAPVRIVYLVDEPARRGFAYGTLAGHPERGEEAFIISIGADGRVMVEITAFSRHATWWARLAGPVTRAVQARITDRYIRALQAGVKPLQS